MRRGVFALLALFAFACAHGTPRRAIVGNINSSAGLLPGVRVTLCAPGQRDRVTVTDANGTYAFKGLRPGTYVLRMERAGYESARYPGMELKPEADLRIGSALLTPEEAAKPVVWSSEPPTERMALLCCVDLPRDAHLTIFTSSTSNTSIPCGLPRSLP